MGRLTMPLVLVLLVAIMVAYFNIARFFPFLSNLWVTVLFGSVTAIILFILIRKWIPEN